MNLLYLPWASTVLCSLLLKYYNLFNIFNNPAKDSINSLFCRCGNSSTKRINILTSLISNRRRIQTQVVWFPREGNGTLLQYSCLENPIDRGAWGAAVHGVARSRTRLSDFTFTFHFHAWEKEMATHSSVLAWSIPWKGEPGGLLSMGSHRVGHDWSDLAAVWFPN